MNNLEYYESTLALYQVEDKSFAYNIVEDAPMPCSRRSCDICLFKDNIDLGADCAARKKNWAYLTYVPEILSNDQKEFLSMLAGLQTPDFQIQTLTKRVSTNVWPWITYIELQYSNGDKAEVYYVKDNTPNNMKKNQPYTLEELNIYDSTKRKEK